MRASDDKALDASDEAIGLTGESVDFNSVLSAVSGNLSGESTVDAHPIPKDLNLSSVIASIQDEGPAVRADTCSPAKASRARAMDTEKLQSPGALPIEEQVTAQTESSVAPTRRGVQAEDEEQPATTPSSNAQTTPPQEIVTPVAQPAAVASWTGIMLRVVVTGLIAVAIGTGYSLYQAQLHSQQSQAEASKLYAELGAMKARVLSLEEQLQKQGQRMQNLLTHEQVQEQLRQQRHDIDARLQSELRLLRPIQLPVVPLETPAQPETTAQPKQEPVAEALAPKPVKAEKQESQAASAIEKPVEKKSAMAGEGGKSGRWIVHLASHANEAKAQKTLRRYAQQIPDASIQVAKVKGRKVYRVSVTGFASKKDALAYQKKVSRELGLKGAWIAKGVRDKP